MTTCLPAPINARRSRRSTVWEFIPLSEYHPPPEPSIVPLDLIKRNQSPTRTPESNEAPEENRRWRESWIRPINWDEAAEALDGTLTERCLEPPSAGTAQVVLGLSGGAGQLVQTWANSQGAVVLDPPSIDKLLDGSAEVWPELRKAEDGVLVIPALERCFLRHHRGLRLVRQVIEAAWEYPRRLVIGCDVWAWKFLQTAVNVDTLCSNPLITAPLDAHRLRGWLPALTAENERVQFVVDGEECFSPDSTSGSRVLCQLAADSHGAPVLAWRLWRSMLQEASRGSVGGAVEFDLTSAAGSPASLVSLPDTRLAWYLLHTLLLHAGLPANVLPKLLPFGATPIWQALSALRDHQHVNEEQGLWRVAVKRYSEVCRRLASVGFWVSEI